ncbi:MAG TPA: malonyl-CoA decarboxylase family protein [Burkholderiales bacterium]|nr:malonyl-CoA decarboxylase family protein [Burkholderiales bacterium]
MNPQSFLKRLLRSVAAPVDSARSAERRAREAIELCRSLLSERGEVSGAALARDVLAAYDALPANAFKPFIDLLGKEFSPSPMTIAAAAASYALDPSPQNLVVLQRAVEPPRQELFRRMNVAPGATAALVDLRRRLLRELKANPDWVGVDADLEHLFGSWFNRGFLRLERIDWRTPALILEKLIEYEAVHEIAGWKDLHRRLASDRRCFAFFHPALPEEPLIFVETALTERISTAVAPLLDPESLEADATRADCAIFYSITNCQEGLRGISFGNLLIKQVVYELGREFPRLKTFATLSPVPGFRAWLGTIARERTPNLPDLSRLNDDNWLTDAQFAEQVRLPLMGLCAHYLTVVRKNDEPLDPVARFHLGNGARMEKLNWLADTSKQGMQRSAGIMVNYLYRLADVEKNHEAFVREHEVVASHELRKLARECVLAAPSARV